MTLGSDSASAAWAVFCDLPADHPAARALADASVRRSVAASETLIHQGDPDTALYLVVSGVLRAVKYSQNGHEIWLAGISPGDLVGELGCLTGKQRTSSVVVDSDAALLAVSSQKFLELMVQYAELSIAVSRLLAKRLSRTSDQLTELTALPVPTRLHQELLRSGTPDPDDSEVLVITSPPTISELAKRIHTSRETASRAFGSLEHQGLLKRVAGEVQVINPRFS